MMEDQNQSRLPPPLVRSNCRLLRQEPESSSSNCNGINSTNEEEEDDKKHDDTDTDSAVQQVIVTKAATMDEAHLWQCWIKNKKSKSKYVVAVAGNNNNDYDAITISAPIKRRQRQQQYYRIKNLSELIILDKDKEEEEANSKDEDGLSKTTITTPSRSLRQQPLIVTAVPIVSASDLDLAVVTNNTCSSTAINNDVSMMTDTILRQRPHNRIRSTTGSTTDSSGTIIQKKNRRFIRKRRTNREGYYFYDKNRDSDAYGDNENEDEYDVDVNYSWRRRLLLLLLLLIGGSGFMIYYSTSLMINKNTSADVTTTTSSIATTATSIRGSLLSRSNSSSNSSSLFFASYDADSNNNEKGRIENNNSRQEEDLGATTSSTTTTITARSIWTMLTSTMSDFLETIIEIIPLDSITTANNTNSFSNNNSSLQEEVKLVTATKERQQQRQRRRSLSSPSSSSKSTTSSSSSSSSSSTRKNNNNFPQLVIAGKMSVDDAPCNIAQYNLKTGIWSLNERIQLSLYNSYSGGEVYSLLANHTDRLRLTEEMASTPVKLDPIVDTSFSFTPIIRGSRPSSSSSSRSSSTSTTKTTTKYNGSGELIVVGAFDTTYRNSQVTYCSVGKWDGYQLSKVGEGLCNSALSKGMKITTAAMAGPQDVYAAGSFQTQVWNGDRHEFVKIYNIAHYNAAGKEGPVWLPLNIGQITCSWCTVTVLALAWDSKRRQLHVAGKFNAIDGRNVPAGLAIYDLDSGQLLAHPGGGLAMKNSTQDGVGTALQLDEEKGVLYVMGSFQRLTATSELCYGLAAYDISANRWTCLANKAHTVQPTGGGNMLLTPYGLMVAGKTSGETTTWKNESRPYTIALLRTTLKKVVAGKNDTTTKSNKSVHSSPSATPTTKPSTSGISYNHSNNATSSSSSHHQKSAKNVSYHEFVWSWLPGFKGNDEPLHALANGFGDHEGTVFIAGDNLVAKWSYQERTVTTKPKSSNDDDDDDGYSTSGSRSSSSSSVYDRSSSSLLSPSIVHSHPSSSSSSHSSSIPERHTEWVAITEQLSNDHVRGAIMAISQMQLMPDHVPHDDKNNGSRSGNSDSTDSSRLNIIIMVTLVTGCFMGILISLMCNRKWSSKLLPCFGFVEQEEGIPLDTLQIGHSNLTDAYKRAMKVRYVNQPQLLTIIDPQEIFLQRIIGEGTFGRVWSARWNSASVAVKEFVFAQAAVIGRSSMQQQIVEEIIGEAGMMAILRHPNVLQLFGCSLTAQAIWIVSELCSLGSLRQILDDRDRPLPDDIRLNLALQVAEGMTYLHNQNPSIIHRDLKSHNIFVHETFIDTEQPDDSNINGPSGDGHTNQLTRWLRPQKMKSHSTLIAKIGDWGSARATLSGSRTMTHGVGTACWLAPEVIKHARSSKYSDVYGYGIILWEMGTRKEVYGGLESTQIIAMVANEGLRPPVPEDCPWKDVMVKCWAENPQDRLGFNEVVVELNKISKKLDEKNKIENDIAIAQLELEEREQEQKQKQNDEGTNVEEETPLIEENISSSIRSKSRIFSNILRQRKGE